MRASVTGQEFQCNNDENQTSYILLPSTLDSYLQFEFILSGDINITYWSIELIPIQVFARWEVRNTTNIPVNVYAAVYLKVGVFSYFLQSNPIVRYASLSVPEKDWFQFSCEFNSTSNEVHIFINGTNFFSISEINLESLNCQIGAFGGIFDNLILLEGFFDSDFDNWKYNYTSLKSHIILADGTIDAFSFCSSKNEIYQYSFNALGQFVRY